MNLTKLSPKMRAGLLLSVGVIAISLSAIFVRYAQASGIVVAFYRMLLSGLLLLPTGVASLRKQRVTRVTLLPALGAGLCLAAHFALWISSLSYTSVAASASLATTTPLWIALLAWLFLAMRPRWQVLAGLALAIIGGIVIATAEQAASSQPLLGNMMALVSAICAAAYFLLTRNAQQAGLAFQAAMFIIYGSSALFLLPLPAVFAFSYTDYTVMTFFWMLMLALVPQLMGHSSFNYAMRHLPPTLVGTLILLEPIGATVLAFFLLQEIPTQQTLCGGAILLTGVIVSSSYSRINSAS